MRSVWDIRIPIIGADADLGNFVFPNSEHVLRNSLLGMLVVSKKRQDMAEGGIARSSSRRHSYSRSCIASWDRERRCSLMSSVPTQAMLFALTSAEVIAGCIIPGQSDPRDFGLVDSQTLD